MGKLSRSSAVAKNVKKSGQLSLESFFTRPKPAEKLIDPETDCNGTTEKEVSSSCIPDKDDKFLNRRDNVPSTSTEKQGDMNLSTNNIEDDSKRQIIEIPNTPDQGDSGNASTPKTSQGSLLYQTHIVPETPVSQMKSSRFRSQNLEKTTKGRALDLTFVENENIRKLHTTYKENLKESELLKHELYSDMIGIGIETKKNHTEIEHLLSNSRGAKLSRSYKKALRTTQVSSKGANVSVLAVQNISDKIETKQNVCCNLSIDNKVESTTIILNSSLSDDDEDFLNAGLEELFQKSSQRKSVQYNRLKNNVQKTTKRKHGKNKADVHVEEDGTIKPLRLHLKRGSTKGISPNEKRKPSTNLRNPFAKSSTCNKILFSEKRLENVVSSFADDVDSVSVFKNANVVETGNTVDKVDCSSVVDTTKVAKIDDSFLVKDNSADIDICANTDEVKATNLLGCSFDTKSKLQPDDLYTPTKKVSTAEDLLTPNTKAFLESMDNSLVEEDVAMMSQDSDSCPDLQRTFSDLFPFKDQSAQSSDEPEYPDLNRYIVVKVVDQQFQKEVHVKAELDGVLKVCTLKGTWCQMPISEGMVVAIHGAFDKSNQIVVNQSNNFIVLKPDILLTGTAIAGSIKCKRRSVLRERFKGADFSNKAMLCGTILHEVFEKAISKKTFNKEFLEMTAKEVLRTPSIINDMFRIGLRDEDVLQVVDEYVGPIIAWARKYYCAVPKISSSLDVKFPNEMKPSKSSMCVSELKDIEENVCSPRWGIKGKVDLTVEVKIHREKPHQKQTLILPLELKTGRETNSMEHRSQLLLYSFLLSELGCSKELGFLLYLKTGSMISVPATHMDKRELINLRNHLAYFITQSPSKGENKESWSLPLLPEPIQDTFTCTKCSELHHCALLHRLESNPVILSENIAKFYQEKLEHLNEEELQYFREWFLMCMLEHTSAEQRKINSEMWLVDAWKREQKDQCYSGMLLTSCKPGENSSQYLLTFKRKPLHPSNKPLTSVQLTVGQRLAVTKEKTNEVALCVGFIVEVTSEYVVIATDRELRTRGKNAIYRLDKDDSYNSMASSLVNLGNLMKNEPTSSHIRQLILDTKQPGFEDAPIDLPTNVHAKVKGILADLNKDQRCVIDKVLRSNDYTLVVGMPGTGKTTTIVALVRVLVYYGKSVLLTSYTHSAIDNILLKLCKHDVKFIRLGRSLSIHPDVRRFSEETVAKRAKGIEEITHIYNTVPIVATTCLGSKHAIFSQRHFDVCIVDEASQISQPVCLGPLLLANRFVLVGDHHQLPPLVQSKHAKLLGMDESLFKRLATSHPSATISLTFQYRMNLEIMKLSNILVYGGALQCGSDKVARSTLSLTNWDAFRNKFNQVKWLLQLLDPKSTVRFLNMDDVESDCQSSYSTNQNEANVMIKLVDGLLNCGCKGTDIGLVSPYRNQCLLVESMLPSLAVDASQVEVNTIDKYQGRDKEVIIVSFVKTATQGELLHDIRRLNVALTRAKRKLLLIGSYKALNGYEPLRNLLIHLMQDKLITLYSDA
ncbi:DNA replication ATP-dependent helicase/nuclease DNA2-like [Antedon mediterranea]|uniref:DNA replication ATP-dependent helicase/nuclease DNA2-like n=1 Tax=Antedon mediterranea TaxID=105859 RepID=UPI003AF94040